MRRVGIARSCGVIGRVQRGGLTLDGRIARSCPLRSSVSLNLAAPRRSLATAEAAEKDVEGRNPNVLWDSEKTWPKTKNPTPDFAQDRVVTRAQLKALLADTSAGALLLDLRSVGACKVEPGVPGATNIPADDLLRSVALDEGKWRARYGFSKPRPESHIVVYITPEEKSQLHETLTLLADHGYSRVQVYEGGAREWNKHENPEF